MSDEYRVKMLFVNGGRRDETLPVLLSDGWTSIFYLNDETYRLFNRISRTESGRSSNEFTRKELLSLPKTTTSSPTVVRR